MKKLLLLIPMFLIVGCDDRPKPEYRKSDTSDYSIICVEKYEYIYGPHRLAPKFNAEGKPSKC